PLALSNSGFFFDCQRAIGELTPFGTSIYIRIVYGCQYLILAGCGREGRVEGQERRMHERVLERSDLSSRRPHPGPLPEGEGVLRNQCYSPSAWRGLPLTFLGNFFQVRSTSLRRSSRTSRVWLTRWPWPRFSIIFFKCGACCFHSSVPAPPK